MIGIDPGMRYTQFAPFRDVGSPQVLSSCSSVMPVETILPLHSRDTAYTDDDMTDTSISSIIDQHLRFITFTPIKYVCSNE